MATFWAKNFLHTTEKLCINESYIPCDITPGNPAKFNRRFGENIATIYMVEESGSEYWSEKQTAPDRTADPSDPGNKTLLCR
jgi:hypothetical protein